MNLVDPLSNAFLPPPAGVDQADGRSGVGAARFQRPAASFASISDLGRNLSLLASGGRTAASSRYPDIEDSDLPDAVKQLLRMIRALREKLAKLAQELQAIQADQHMNRDVKRNRLLQIQGQMSALNGALLTATRKLASMVRDQQLDRAQQLSAGQLALRPA